MWRWLILLGLSLGLTAQELRIQVLNSTDMHSYVMPEDPFTLQPEPKGWAKLATLIKIQKEKVKHTLLLDCGDSLQGHPMAYVRHRVRPDLPEPSVAIMNALGYHAMTVGNHEFDFGMATLRKVEEQAQFPFLAANLVEAASGRPAFTPYIVQEFEGARVAVLGLSTAATPQFTEPANYRGLRFRDVLEAAREWIPKLRTQERADVVIVALHAGLGDLKHPDLEDQGLALVDQVPGIDLLLTGHTHRLIQASHKGVPILQAQAHGRALGVAELQLQKDKERWKLTQVRTELVKPDAATVLDTQVLELTRPLRETTDRYLDTFATQLKVDLDGRWCRMEETPVAQLLHAVLRQATGAQLTAITPPGPRFFVPAGPTSVRQFFALMPYENRVVRIRVSGTQLKAWLEHAARIYRFSWEPELFTKDLGPGDFDPIDGCSYAIDLGKPVGSRITQLTFQGRPIRPDQEFTLATTTYRLYGGGGYLQAMRWQGEPEFISAQGFRNLLLEYVLGRPSLDVPTNQHWRTIPFLDRERMLVR